MAIDMGVVITSGTVSALVGGGVSYFTARHVAVRQERAKSHEAARRAVSDVVGPLLRDVRKYRARANPALGRDPAHGPYLGDMLLCAQVLNASAGLPSLKKRRVRKRCERIFGPGTVRTCELHGFEASDGFAVTAVGLFGRGRAEEYPDEDLPQMDRGLLDSALRKPPPDMDVANLIGEFERLARCR